MAELKADRDFFHADGNIRIGYIDNSTKIELKLNSLSEIPLEVAQLWKTSISEEDLFQEELEFDHDIGEPETVLISSETGPFLLGSERGLGIPEWETTPVGKPAQTNLPSYRIGKYPITNFQYWLFLSENKDRRIPTELNWENYDQPSKDQFDLPVSGVNWYEAQAYCAWLFEKTNRPYTLPSEAQWEKAARGVDGRLFPWGDEWNPEFCNTNLKKTSVDAYMDFSSPFHCVDMVGNVREWTTTIWGEKRLQPIFGYPMKEGDRRDFLDVNSQVRRCVRGGAALPLAREIPLRVARRGSEKPTSRGLFKKARIGFRVAIQS